MKRVLPSLHHCLLLLILQILFVCSLGIALEEHLSILLVTFSDEPAVAAFCSYQVVAWGNKRFKRAVSYSSNDLYRNVLVLLQC